MKSSNTLAPPKVANKCNISQPSVVYPMLFLGGRSQPNPPLHYLLTLPKHIVCSTSFFTRKFSKLFWERFFYEQQEGISLLLETHQHNLVWTAGDWKFLFTQLHPFSPFEQMVICSKSLCHRLSKLSAVPQLICGARIEECKYYNNEDNYDIS